jgi:hypothetical protein
MMFPLGSSVSSIEDATCTPEESSRFIAILAAVRRGAHGSSGEVTECRERERLTFSRAHDRGM